MPTSPRQLPITEFAHKAGVVGDAGLATVRAAFDVAAKQGRAAGLDRCHDAALGLREPLPLRGAKGLTVAAEDVRHLQPRAHARRSRGWDHPERETVER